MLKIYDVGTTFLKSSSRPLPFPLPPPIFSSESGDSEENTSKKGYEIFFWGGLFLFLEPWLDVPSDKIV